MRRVNGTNGQSAAPRSIAAGHGGIAFRDVEQQSDDPRHFSEVPRDVRRPDVPAAVVADVRPGRDLHDEKAEWDRPDQVRRNHEMNGRAGPMRRVL